MQTATRTESSDKGALSDWTTRRWLRTGVATTLAVLAVLGSLGGWAMWRTSQITSELVDRRSPALIEAMRVEQALVNQETGIRGYGLSGRSDFLQPYARGLADEKAALRRLRPLAEDDRARADLAEVERLAGTWQRRVARPVSQAPAQEAVKLTAERAAEGKAEFDALRRAMTRQQDHLRIERAASTRTLKRAETLRNWMFAVIAVLIVLVAVLISEGLRRGVTGPLTRLGSAARDVAQGRFDRSLAGTGPADLRQLAHDVEAMRQRLVAELEFSERTRTLLDEQAEDLKRSNTELEQFAYVASHDLQEPLRKVSSFTQLLQRRYGGQLDAKADQYIAFAVDGANRMQTLINDLLAFSRVGRVHNDHQTVDLESVMNKALDNLSVSIEETGAEITHDPLPTVVGDATQLGMLWQNLLSNAIKFRSPDRPPRVHVGAVSDAGVWTFSVTDNGIGIAPEFHEKVFVLFQRLHTKDAYPGTGIGLAMCKKVVEFHDGTIGIDPDRTTGTRVVFTLPAAGSSSEAPPRETQP
ncbi:ATP-binding protein [Streptomyces sp. ATE26]|uniref:sensor histidine kinase n=1 Tax=unclassified Streptomyces TaxID=2593676 RepID=UPI001166AFD6|nr:MULTISPECIES: sensor histidine kinase [unclassified Streptomyces]MDI1459265.1 ATP-binding protein [Streptomyces sp. ATE26]GEK01686.1 histidine kinase [Streptomyces sp. 1-11]